MSSSLTVSARMCRAPPVAHFRSPSSQTMTISPLGRSRSTPRQFALPRRGWKRSPTDSSARSHGLPCGSSFATDPLARATMRRSSLRGSLRSETHQSCSRLWSPHSVHCCCATSQTANVNAGGAASLRSRARDSPEVETKGHGSSGRASWFSPRSRRVTLKRAGRLPLARRHSKGWRLTKITVGHS